MTQRQHILLIAILVALVSSALLLFFLKADFTPPLASTQGEPIDAMLRLLFSVGGVIFALCLVLLIYSAVAFRRRPGDEEDGPPIEGNPRLETLWTLVPLAIVLALAFQGALVLRDISRASTAQELEVRVTAFQWGWRFEYPEQAIGSRELWLPIDRPVRFTLISLDVVHSFWVPEFRVKQDAVPGMETTLRVTPSKAGRYTLSCAELCGLAHAQMQAPVVVVTAEEFERWVQEQKE